MKFLTIWLICINLLLISCKRDFSNIVKNSKITSSGECANSPAKNLIDIDSLTSWNACAGGKQWVDFEFSNNVDIKSLSFNFLVSKKSPIHYDIMVKSSTQDYKNIESKSIEVESGQVITLDKQSEGISHLKLIVQNDSSWISIQDLKIIGR